MRSLWLAKKGKRSVALKMLPDREKKRVDFEIIHDIQEKDVGQGTVRRGSATCPVCGYTTPVASVRKQLKRPPRWSRGCQVVLCGHYQARTTRTVLPATH